MNAYVKSYRDTLAKSGRIDDRPDDILTWEEGNWARQNAPELFERYPDFAQEWGQIREANAPGLMEEGTRAFKRAGIGLGSTALGGAALITGSDYLKRKAAALSMQASDPDLAPTIPTLEDIRPGEDGPGQAFSRDTLRYGISKVGEAVPSLGEAVTLGLVGGAIGSAIEPGAGTVVGAGAGVVEGLIGRGIIRKAIKSLVSKGVTEEALVSGLRKGVPEVIEAVTKNAKAIAGAQAGTVTAGLNSFVLNAGDVYSENDDRGVALGLGLISAIPDTVLPALIVRKMFPGVSIKAGKEAARELVGSNALKLAKAAGVMGFEGGTESFQEAVNIAARNLKNGVDPLTVTDDDKIRIREAGITGAVGGALASPAVVLEREAQDVTMAPEAPPPAPAAAPLVPPPTPLAPPTTLTPYQRVSRMTPEQQVARLAELEAKAGRSVDEEAEYVILRASVPTAAVAPSTPEAAAAVAAGNLPLAPTVAPTVAPTTLPEPGAVATPQPSIATSEAVAPVPAEFEPVDIGDRSGRPTGAAEEAIVAQMRKDAGLPQRGVAERVFYRGTNPESAQRIREPFDAAKGKTFAARTPEGAAQYGSSIEEIKAKPNAKILSDDTPGFWKVIGRKRPANGYIGSAGRKGESLVSVVNEAIKKAETAGYDAISIGDADIGTVILNEKAFVRTAPVAPVPAVPVAPVAVPEVNLQSLSESRLLSLAQQLGIDPRKMSGDRLRARIESNARPEAIQEALGIKSSLGSTSGVDSTAPAALSFRDATGTEVSAADRAIIGEFERVLNQRLAPGEPRYRLTAKEVPEDTGVLRPKFGASTELVGSGRAGQILRLRASLEKTFGKRILFVDYGRDGAQNAATSPETPNTILVNTRAPFPFSALVGHELTHNLRTQRPDLYDTLVSLVESIKPVPISYETERAKYYQRDAIHEEYAADMVGDRFHEPAFWEEMGRQADRLGQRGKFAELLAHISEWLAGVLRKIVNLNPVTATRAIRNIEQMQKAIAGVMVRYAAGDGPSAAPRTSPAPTNPAVQAQRTQEFQAVMGRMVANGANIQLLGPELLAQQTGEVLQQQVAALQQRLQQATTAPQRNELAKQIALREERLAEVAQMRGVTYSPHHIAVAMDDVANASLDNLVTLLHEAAESLTMSLTPAQQGAVFRGVEAATAQMQAKMQAAAQNTGATVANVPDAGELLAETMAQTLAAEGVADAATLAEAIVRWVKEVYYRVAMAAQRIFGAEPNPELALDWYENQLRRELGGDYQYSLANLLDRFLPKSNAAYAAKFSGATGTPGGMTDFFDPTTGKLQQPWVEPLSDEALAWNMKFQTTGPNPGESEGIPAEEAVARQSAASYNDQIEWLAKLKADIAPTMDEGEFLGLVSRGELTPHQMLATLKERYPGIEDAKIGGERMTDAMNKWAAHQSLQYIKGVQAAHLSRIAKMQEGIANAEERFTEHASELNRLEPDVRNAELHEGELKKKFRGILDGLLKSLKNGYLASSRLGMMVANEENLGDRDPLPPFYAQAFANLLSAQIPLFDYVEAIALLDLPIEDMTAEQIWQAIRQNTDTSEKLQELSRNKPLAMTIAVLAKNSARQLDQIQLRRSDADTFLDIRKELEGIRNANEAQLREMLKTVDNKDKARGLRQRLRTNYLKERRALKRQSDSIAATEARIDVLEKAKPAVAEKVNEMQQAIGGVFSEWTPYSGAEMVAMRRQDNGSFQKATRTLESRKDGSFEDADGILNDLAQNEQWLKANVDRAGQKEYEQVKHQTRAMENMDVQRAYLSHNYGKVMGMIDAFVRPLQAIAKQAGHSSGSRIVQQFNKYEFINRSGAKALLNQSYEWGAAMDAAMKAAGITDVGQFRAQIYNPVKFLLGVNAGLDRGQAIRAGIAEARKHLTKPPAANFNEKFEAFLLKDKAVEDELLKTAEDNGVLVWDDKLRELRKAIAKGWSTGMRTMNDGVVVTLIHDMEKAGWKLQFDKDEAKQNKRVVTRANTFAALDPRNAQSPEEAAAYYDQLENTDALRAAIKPYFTPGIVERWLLPFINKPGESVFSHDGKDISQLDLQNAWAKSGGDVLNWIDQLGQMIEVTPAEDASAAATFRGDMLAQLDHLFGWEAKMAYESEQTPDTFGSQGSKLHVMMDARVNDLMPAEHVSFAMHDPTSVRQMLGQIAFHGAFGRNGASLIANLRELEAVSVAKKNAFDSLGSTTVEGKRREAKDKGFDYDDLKRAVDHYHDVLELKGEIEAAMGVKNIYGPLYDARAGMELLGFMVGQVVDQPKTAGLNFLSLGARPFAMHSLSPKVLKATAMSYGELAKNTFGGLLHDFGIDLVRMSDYAKETGEVEGKAFRRLPFGTILAGDKGKDGSFQSSLSQRSLVRPLRHLRAIQKKGVGPGLAAIPGLGTMQRFSTEASMANIRGQTWLLQQIINGGIKHFSAHPEDLANPAFRFNAGNLKLKGERGMYDWFRNKTVEYNMGPIEKIVRDAIARQQAGERTITTEMVEQLAQMNAQELDGASSINTAPAGLAQNQALKVMLPLLRWPLWMMHAAHEGLADANGRADFKSMMRGIGRLAAWNLPLGLAFTFLIDEYDEKMLKKKNAMPQVSKLAAIPGVGVPLALATSPRGIPQELLGIGQRMIRSGNIYGLGGDAAQLLIAPFDPASGQRQFSLDQRVLVMSQLLNMTQAISNMVNQGGTATWGSVYRPMVASVGGNGMLNSLDIVNNLLGLDNAESRLTQRINAARWVNTAAKELGYETRKASGFSASTPMSVQTREMQLAAMANSRADFMAAYQQALAAARETVAGDERIPVYDREREAMARVLSSWRSRNPFSGLAATPTPDQKNAMLRAMNDSGRADVQDAMRYYDAYTRLIAPSDMDQLMARRMRAADPTRQMETMRRRAAGAMMAQ